MLEQINHDIRHIDCHNVLDIIETYSAYGIPTRKEYTMDIQNDVLDYLGSSYTEEELHKDFDGKTLDGITATLNEWFPAEDNERLANAIYDFVE